MTPAQTLSMRPLHLSVCLCVCVSCEEQRREDARVYVCALYVP